MFLVLLTIYIYMLCILNSSENIYCHYYYYLYLLNVHNWSIIWCCRTCQISFSEMMFPDECVGSSEHSVGPYESWTLYTPWYIICLSVCQTQPVPNPISYYMHRSPWWFHRFETLSNHFIELVVPFFTFMGRRMCMVNGVLQILFQAGFITCRSPVIITSVKAAV